MTDEQRELEELEMSRAWASFCNKVWKKEAENAGHDKGAGGGAGTAGGLNNSGAAAPERRGYYQWKK